jgi:hypothetical protein
MTKRRSPAHQIAQDVLLWVPVGLMPIGNGLIRLTIYQHAVGEQIAGWISALLDCGLIVFYAAFLTPPRSAPLRSATWLACTTTLHFALGLLVFAIPIWELLLKYNLLHGEPWLVVNLAIVLAPWLADRLFRCTGCG